MCIELKIKAKHLSLEPGIIRTEERKLKAQIKYLKRKGEETTLLSRKFESLHLHRCNEVRNAARATHLARTYLAGQPYSLAEKKRKEDGGRERIFDKIIIPRITAMVNKYSGKPLITDILIKGWAKLPVTV